MKNTVYSYKLHVYNYLLSHCHNKSFPLNAYIKIIIYVLYLKDFAVLFRYQLDMVIYEERTKKKNVLKKTTTTTNICWKNENKRNVMSCWPIRQEPFVYIPPFVIDLIYFPTKKNDI